MNVRRLLFVGSSGKGALEKSYVNAANKLNLDVSLFDPAVHQKKYIKGGSIGEKIHLFMPVEPWVRKMNRELVISVKNYKPDVLVLFTSAKVLPGTLATIRTILPLVKFVWIWPDTPLNITLENISNIPLIDLLATYSSASIKAFSQLGLKNIIWIPLAGDPLMHGKDVISEQFDSDISFVGMWRPEREAAMSVICKHFPDRKIVIYGMNWDRDCKDPLIKTRVAGKGLFENQLSDFFNRSRININVIDDTNFPAANMRFFEVPVSGGLQLSSSCPEMENEFKDRESILYFHNDEELVSSIQWIFQNELRASAIRKAGHTLAHSSHTYTHRLQQIIENLKA